MTGPSLLAGRRLIVPVTPTRRGLADQFEAAGAEVLPAEFLRIGPPVDLDALETAARGWTAGRYSWLAVTSRNAVEALARAAGGTLEVPAGSAVAAVGAATVEACVAAGLEVAVVPTAHGGAIALAAAVPVTDGGERPVLAPLGNRAAGTLAEALAERGWAVDEVEAYRTEPGPGMDAPALAALAAGAVDAVLLTSGSVAEAFAAQAGDVRGTIVVAIGATTALAARAAGVAVAAVADEPTFDGLARALGTALEGKGGVADV